MRLFRTRPVPTREDIRRAVPKKRAEVEARSDGEVTVLRVPLAQRRGLVGWAARKSNSPTQHEIELDEVGSFVWGLCDGKRSLAGIASKLSKHYKITIHEAEVSLLDFVDSLRRRGCLILERK